MFHGGKFCPGVMNMCGYTGVFMVWQGCRRVDDMIERFFDSPQSGWKWHSFWYGSPRADTPPPSKTQPKNTGISHYVPHKNLVIFEN